ncbi:MAG: SPOR domain-containing protein [Gammaproteobacteria bacterium]|nr:SPOR domain-containing protein [Gammaproteobacteria bacterium]
MKSKLSILCFAVGLFTVGNALATTADMNTSKTMNTSKATLSFDQIKMAAESGDSDAQYALGYMYYYGKGGAPKDSGQAKIWIGKSAAQKQPQAIKALALMTAQQKSAPASTPQQTVTPNMPDKTAAQENSAAPESKNSPAQQATADARNQNMTLVDMRKKEVEEEIATAAPTGGEGYTVQLLGSSDRVQIAKLVREHHLGNAAKIYKTTFKNKDWFVLIYGQFKTQSEAKMEAKRLETELALKPWVKPFASVKRFNLIAAS